ncbi:hypothetical protein HH303_10530 [Rhodospirillaceae bacterium KN72]|uniref:Uncharacterized protein n=1 Tax=Pacificispira spongiicola TaxID=2729598 RepID=A0A7Y0E0D3_9PROT|nr:hypothetical protein [Pacificispira spongiicola]NMM44914.1 hypothetical protein [Pacificispira spongiicola]
MKLAKFPEEALFWSIFISTAGFIIRAFTQSIFNFFLRIFLCKSIGFNILFSSIFSTLSGILFFFLYFPFFGPFFITDLQPTLQSALLDFLAVTSPCILAGPTAALIVYAWRGEVFESRFDPNFVNPKAERLAQGL